VVVQRWNVHATSDPQKSNLWTAKSHLQDASLIKTITMPSRGEICFYRVIIYGYLLYCLESNKKSPDFRSCNGKFNANYRLIIRQQVGTVPGLHIFSPAQ